MIAAQYTSGLDPGPISALGYFAILVLYAIGCGYVIIRRRRQAIRRQRIAVEIFD